VRIPHEQRSVFSSLRILHEKRESSKPTSNGLYPATAGRSSSCAESKPRSTRIASSQRLQSKQMVRQETSYSKAQVLNHVYCSRRASHNKLASFVTFKHDRPASNAKARSPDWHPTKDSHFSPREVPKSQLTPSLVERMGMRMGDYHCPGYSLGGGCNRWIAMMEQEVGPTHHCAYYREEAVEPSYWIMARLLLS